MFNVRDDEDAIVVLEDIDHHGRCGMHGLPVGGGYLVRTTRQATIVRADGKATESASRSRS